jgi:hypothetical protein
VPPCCIGVADGRFRCIAATGENRDFRLGEINKKRVMNDALHHFVVLFIFDPL